MLVSLACQIQTSCLKPNHLKSLSVRCINKFGLNLMTKNLKYTELIVTKSLLATAELERINKEDE